MTEQELMNSMERLKEKSEILLYSLRKEEEKKPEEFGPII